MYVCLFDIDGTLLSSGGAGKAAMEAALERAFGVQLSDHRVTYSGRTDRAIARDLFAIHGIAENEETWKQFVDTYLQLLPDCLASHQGRILPGVLALLETLSNRDDFAVGLLTGNLRAGARIKLGHYGIHEHFSFGGYGDHHFDRDDVAREACAQACDLLQRLPDPNRLWVIGDTPLDIRCARAIGARVAAVATGLHTVEELAVAEPDLLFTDLSNPEPLMKFWR